MEDLLVAIVGQLAEKEGLSDHQIGKRLGLGMSQLNRALALLCADETNGGLGLIEVRQDAKRRTLWLSARGHSVCKGS